MPEVHQKRIIEFQDRIADDGIDLAVIYDSDNIYYLSGFWGYLGMDFGRPTLLVVPRSGTPTLITPGMEAEMAFKMTGLDDVRQWTDGIGGEWRSLLDELMGHRKNLKIGLEPMKTHPTILSFLENRSNGTAARDVSTILSEMRMIKSPEDLIDMRRAGRVAVAMCEAAAGTIAQGIPEYEIALAAINAGTQKAAELLEGGSRETLHTPVIHDLQILQSGSDLAMVHRRPTTRRLGQGDPVYLCFCPFTLFKQIKLGFDREYFVGRVSDEHARLYEIAIEAQAAALNTIRPVR